MGRAPASRVGRGEPDVLGDVAQGLRGLHHVAEAKGSAVGGPVPRAALVHVDHAQLEVPLSGQEVQGEHAASPGQLQIDVTGGRVEARGHELQQAEAGRGRGEAKPGLAVVVDLAVGRHAHDGVLVGLLDGVAEAPVVFPHRSQEALAPVSEVVGDTRVVALHDDVLVPEAEEVALVLLGHVRGLEVPAQVALLALETQVGQDASLRDVPIFEELRGVGVRVALLRTQGDFSVAEVLVQGRVLGRGGKGQGAEDDREQEVLSHGSLLSGRDTAPWARCRRGRSGGSSCRRAPSRGSRRARPRCPR